MDDWKVGGVLTGALLDRLTHRVHLIEANRESYRLAEAKNRRRRNGTDITQTKKPATCLVTIYSSPWGEE